MNYLLLWRDLRKRDSDVAAEWRQIIINFCWDAKNVLSCKYLNECLRVLNSNYLSEIFNCFYVLHINWQLLSSLTLKMTVQLLSLQLKFWIHSYLSRHLTFHLLYTSPDTSNPFRPLSNMKKLFSKLPQCINLLITAFSAYSDVNTSLFSLFNLTATWTSTSNLIYHLHFVVWHFNSFQFLNFN